MASERAVETGAAYRMRTRRSPVFALSPISRLDSPRAEVGPAGSKRDFALAILRGTDSLARDWRTPGLLPKPAGPLEKMRRRIEILSRPWKCLFKLHLCSLTGIH